MSRYKNATLQDNWWEDRQQEGSGLGARLLASQVRTATRCLPWALPAEEQAALFQSTARAAAEQAITSAPPAPPRRPRMVSAANAGAELAARRHLSSSSVGSSSTGVIQVSGEQQGSRTDSAAGAASVGSNQGSTSTLEEDKGRFVTTYRRVFDSERRAALTAHPPSDFTPDQSFPLSSKLHADTWKVASMCPGPPPGGRGGARGEFTRWPAESGSRYGVSVFADEYAAGR